MADEFFLSRTTAVPGRSTTKQSPSASADQHVKTVAVHRVGSKSLVTPRGVSQQSQQTRQTTSSAHPAAATAPLSGLNGPYSPLFAVSTLVAVAVLCRALLYGAVRMTRRTFYGVNLRITESASLAVLFLLGSGLAYVLTHSALLSQLTGIGFVAISMGTVLEAMLANEKAAGSPVRESARRS